MTYQFPPIWFASGSISLVVLSLLLCVVPIAMVAGVIYCWRWPPRSRAAWGMAAVLWTVPLAVFLIGAPRWHPEQIFLEDVPLIISVPAIIVIFGLPLPAIIAVLRELSGKCQPPHRFRELLTWLLVPASMPMACFLMPPVQGGGPSFRLDCANRMKNVVLAMQHYAGEHRTFPDSLAGPGEYPQSWRLKILPFLDVAQDEMHYNTAQPWDSAENSLVARSDISRRYRCPSVTPGYRQDSLGRWYTSYASVTGTNTAYPNGKGSTPEQFPDGLSNTVLVAEACGQQIVWTEPRDIVVTNSNIGINLPGSRYGHSPAVWSSYHRAASNTPMADGSVRPLHVDTDPRVLHAMLTADGGEPEPLD